MPKGTLLAVIALASAAAGCISAAPANTTTPPSTSPPSTSPPSTSPSSTSSSTTSTTSVYESLGEEVAVSESVLGTVSWRQASSFPLGLIAVGEIPSPEHTWTYDWLARYENAHEITGACFEIYQEAAGYLGLGPCPGEWLPEAAWEATEPEWQGNRGWGGGDAPWIWLKESWFSVDGEDWNQTTQTFPDSTAVVTAEPWSVAEQDGRWVVIGSTGVGEDADPADIPWDDRTWNQKYSEGPWLKVPRSAEPTAWVSDNLSDWNRVLVDFGKEGMDTRLTSVVSGDPGWVIFGIRSSQEPPRLTEWVAWASADGLTWEEFPMAGVYDNPCEPSRHEHCGLIKAHMMDDAVVAYAWTWPLEDEYGVSPLPVWRLLIGEF